MDTFVIDKGTRDGIHQGMPVISEKGVVGYVFKATYIVSTVMVITHYNCRVDAIVQRTRSRGIAGGLLKGRCRIFNVLRSENIEAGDVVVTSGLGNRFPRGLLIGTIRKVERKSFGLFQEAELLPGTDFNKLEEVYVLLKPQDEITTAGNDIHGKRK
jgi:rod shape-determining protein MreC